MIIVKGIKKEGKLIGIEIKGHANASKKGTDIICAGVSALGYALLSTCKNLKLPLLKATDKNKIHVLLDFENSNNIQQSTINLLALQTYIGILEIANTYKGYITFKNQES